MISTQGFSLRQFSEKITHFLDNPDNITDFSRKYVVTEDAIKMYVNHMKLLSSTKEKRSKYKATQREEEARKTYKDYDWEGMFHERSLSQLKVVELDKYIAHHNLGKYGTKKAKLEAIKENIIQELAKRIEREEDGNSNSQSSSDSLRRESEDNSEEEDCVLAEIGISSSEKEEESTEEEEMIESTENFNVNTIVYTRSGRRAT